MKWWFFFTTKMNKDNTKTTKENVTKSSENTESKIHKYTDNIKPENVTMKTTQKKE